MDVRLELVYKTPKGLEAMFHSEELPASQAVVLAEDLEKTGRVKHFKFIDRLDRSWTMKELKKFLKGIETEPHNATVYFDGGFDIETQTSGLGCVIYYEQSGKSLRLRKNLMSEQLRSNNEAEYAALHLAVTELKRLGVHHLPVKFVGDSQVVINQMMGEWASYEAELNKWADRIEAKLEELGLQPEYELVERRLNQEADALATQALKNIEIESVFSGDES